MSSTSPCDEDGALVGSMISDPAGGGVGSCGTAGASVWTGTGAAVTESAGIEVSKGSGVAVAVAEGVVAGVAAADGAEVTFLSGLVTASQFNGSQFSAPAQLKYNVVTSSHGLQAHSLLARFRQIPS